MPLGAINEASAREKLLNRGHPNTLHLWWARRPLAAARAVLFAQMVDDPSGHSDLFKTEKAQQKERLRLFRIIDDLVKWESTNDAEVLDRARAEIWQSWRRVCAENAGHPRAKELFNRYELPAFYDPFAGGGALPLEAQRLGLEVFASDLNPVAVLINKAMIEIPPRFAGKPPINPDARSTNTLLRDKWRNGQGLAEDLRFYGQWLRNEAEVRIGSLYPQIQVTADEAEDRPDLKPLVGKKLTVLAWLWARTVNSPNPAFRDVEVPLASTFTLAAKSGTEAYVQPIVEGNDYRFTVRMGKPSSQANPQVGTKLAGANFVCLMSGTPISGDFIKAEAKAGRMGARLMAVVAEGENGRVYLSPTREHESIAKQARPEWVPDTEFFQQALGFRVGNYGMSKWSDLFTPRQLVALGTISGLVAEARERARTDALAAGLPVDRPLAEGGSGAEAYADAIGLLLGFAGSRMADRHSSLCRWQPNPTGYAPKIANTFGRQALPMVWDYVEGNPFGPSSGNLLDAVGWVAKVVETSLSANAPGSAFQVDAQQQEAGTLKVVSTDPPYYDNIGYADLSDFFYVWLRRSLRTTFPDLFSTVATPKSNELVATPARHGGKDKAERFFLDGMSRAMQRLAEQAHPAFPVTLYYAFKQSESSSLGTASTGWETFLQAVIQAGFAITGTWPIRTELANRMRGMDSNALASSIVIVCRRRPADASTVSRREFLVALKSELPLALRHLQAGNIAPVDLAQAAIGPGMAVFTRFAKVLDADGNAMSVRQALALINETLDEVLAEQEGDFDVDSRWALAWFDQHGFTDGPYGVAETLSKAKNTSVDGMVEAGILTSRAGKVRLLAPSELPTDWDPEDDRRTNIWEMLHHLIRVFEHAGEASTAQLLAKYGAKADVVRELAYRLYTACERKKRAKEAASYNALVQSWTEIARLAKEQPAATPQQQTALFDQE